MEMTIDSFNFDNIKADLGVDPFASTANKYAEDNRFYKLTKDKDGNGAALIRFLPDAEKGMIQSVYRINTTISKNGKKRFVNEITPSTIGLKCPFQEEWQRLWNLGKKEDVKDASGNVIEYGSKTFGRGQKFITNIKVLKDPANPENEGKIFLFEMSAKMKQMIQDALNPSEQDKALGAEPKQMFNPLKGHSFRLVSKKGSNDMINYDSSSIIDKEDGIYATVEEAIADIKANTHKLSDLVKEENLLSYDELLKKFKWVTFADSDAGASVTPVQEVQTVQTTQTVAETAPEQTTQTVQTAVTTEKAKDDLDSLLQGLV